MKNKSGTNWPDALIFTVFIVCAFGSCVYCESAKRGISPIQINKCEAPTK